MCNEDLRVFIFLFITLVYIYVYYIILSKYLHTHNNKSNTQTQIYTQHPILLSSSSQSYVVILSSDSSWVFLTHQDQSQKFVHFPPRRVQSPDTKAEDREQSERFLCIHQSFPNHSVLSEVDRNQDHPKRV